MKTSHRVGAILVALSCSACASGKSFNKFDVSKGESVSIDATQRVIFVKNSPTYGQMVCAEPSPDAAMAASNQGALSGLWSNAAQVQLAGSSAEALASIGLRSPAITLVRDLFYRGCEHVMNGLETDPAVIRRYTSASDRIIITLAAIDGLSTAPVAPAVVVGAIGKAEADGNRSRQADGSTTDTSSAKTEITNITYEISDANKRDGTGGNQAAADAISRIVNWYFLADLANDAERPDIPKLLEMIYWKGSAKDEQGQIVQADIPG